MMDVRKKLVEIVCDATQINECIHSCNHPPCAMVQGIVDALIENGVTVQEWISVKDRLPKIGEGVLVYSSSMGVVVDYYDIGIFEYCDITHWMPLPKPPKGE